MLFITFYSLHIEGGIYFILPLSILAGINIIILGLIVWFLVKKKDIDLLLGIFKHVGGAIGAWGLFGTLAGFLQMFDAIENTKEDLPLQVISSGVKVALLPILYALLLLFFTLIAYVLISARKQFSRS